MYPLSMRVYCLMENFRMRKVIKRIIKILIILLLVIIVLLTDTTIYHHVSLSYEVDDITPNGMLVDVGDYKVHVYSEGEKNDKSTLVFMSGSATVAPVYDFKSLYSLLSDEYRIVVVEKAGYGYSDIYEVDRDVDTMVNEVRTAVSMSGERSPYVLVPHSMSGLEAIYWAQQYPDEVVAIAGLDMAVPNSYEHFDFASADRLTNVGRIFTWMGLHRIPGFYALDTTALSNNEMKQQNLLLYKNALNIDYIMEGEAVYKNAMEVQVSDLDIPMMMFVSNGIEIGDYWIPCMQDFANDNNARLIKLECGHYVHNYEYEYIAETMIDWLATLDE